MSLGVFLLFSAFAPAVRAAQTVAGGAVSIAYGDGGYWNDSGTAAGFQALLDGDWVDFSYPGYPYQMFALEFSDGTSDHHYYASSYYYGTTFTVAAESDDSTSTEAVSTYEMEAGDLYVVKREAWEIAGSVVAVTFLVTNLGRTDVSDLRLVYAVDPDQDYASTYSYTTYNDVEDLDGNGADDWVEGVGYYSGYSLAFGACDDSAVELGTFSSWSSVVDADVTLADEEGGAADNAIGIRVWPESDLVAGDTAVLEFLVVVAETEAEAEAARAKSSGRCSACDGDEDGWLSPECDGDDCDDDDASVYPGAIEVWYDGTDQDCDGNDTDQDGDGYDSTLAGGDDCDDEDAAISPGAEETWYDGIDQDCDGNDADQDGDGYDAEEAGGEDCLDTDPETGPGAEETWYDGVDQDCDGNDDDQDGDGYGAEEAGGDDCDDGDPEVNPAAEETWYDGTDQDCDGTDVDQDGDGHPLAEDCDDTDATVWEDCPEDPSGDDTGVGLDPDDNELKGECHCASGGRGAGFGVALAALAAIGARRRR